MEQVHDTSRTFKDQDFFISIYVPSFPIRPLLSVERGILNPYKYFLLIHPICDIPQTKPDNKSG